MLGRLYGVNLICFIEEAVWTALVKRLRKKYEIITSKTKTVILLADNKDKITATLLEQIKNSIAREFYYQWEERDYGCILKKVQEATSAQELTQLIFMKVLDYRLPLCDDYTVEAQLFRKAKLVYIDWLLKEATFQKKINAECLFNHQPVASSEPLPGTEKL